MSHRHSPAAHARAFTLAELLIVLGILALLLALLIPAVSRARAAAATVTCAATLRQYALVNQTYLSEFRDWYLPVKWGFNPDPDPPWPPPPANLAPATIAHQTYPNNPAFRRSLLGPRARPNTARVPYSLICPRATLAHDGATAAGYNFARSYGYNTTGLSAYANPTTYYTGFKRRQVRSPDRKLMFVDATDSTVSQSGSARWDQWGEAWSPPPVQKTNITAYRHRAGANVAFWDGHVQWLPKKDVINNPTLWRPNR